MKRQASSGVRDPLLLRFAFDAAKCTYDLVGWALDQDTGGEVIECALKSCHRLDWQNDWLRQHPSPADCAGESETPSSAVSVEPQI